MIIIFTLSSLINLCHNQRLKPPLEGVESANRLKVLILISDQALKPAVYLSNFPPKPRPLNKAGVYLSQAII